MADTVRYMMEEMVPELEDFVKQKYFSKPEVKQIVKRRQDFEYLLKRKAALKEDYFRYIEYESKLEELRKLRRMALGQKGKKKSLADYAIVRRIHFIFERAVRKFKSDVTIWTSWLEYCRASNSNRRLGRVIGRALQIHPTEPGFWVYAAAWEFEQNGNPAAARALMQQGLRMCKHSEKMWLDYFDMELMYVEKLVARRRVLGLDIPEPNQQQQQQQDPEAAAGQKRQQPEGDSEQQQQDGSSSDKDDGEGPESAAEAAAAAAAASEDNLQQQQQQQAGPDSQAGSPEGTDPSGLDPQAAVRAVLSGAVARLVFQNAIKAAAQKKAGNSSSNFLNAKAAAAAAAAAAGSSGGLGFRAGFLKVLGKYKSPGVGPLRQEVLESIRRDFPQDPAAADILARSACDPQDLTASQEDVQSAVQCYEQLLHNGTLLGSINGTSADNPAAAADGRKTKRQKKSSQQDSLTQQQQQQQQQQLGKEATEKLYRLYSTYLSDRLDVLLTDEARVLDAAAAAQQLFRVYVRAHEAAAAGLEMYLQWVDLAERLKQNKVALKAARLACESYPASPAAWNTRVRLESAAAGAKAASSSSSNSSSSSSSSSSKLLGLIKQGLQQVPAAEAQQLWQQAFDLCSTQPSELQQLQQLLLTAVTTASIKGPPTGGLGSVAATCLSATWRSEGPEAARLLFQKLLLLPPAGGDMFRMMVDLELGRSYATDDATEPENDQVKQNNSNDYENIPEGVVKRVQKVYELWVQAYGSDDVILWVDYALFEQGVSKQGSGRVYYRAVKELKEPDEFIQQYRAKVGLV